MLREADVGATDGTSLDIYTGVSQKREETNLRRRDGLAGLVPQRA